VTADETTPVEGRSGEPSSSRSTSPRGRLLLLLTRNNSGTLQALYKGREALCRWAFGFLLQVLPLEDDLKATLWVTAHSDEATLDRISLRPLDHSHLWRWPIHTAPGGARARDPNRRTRGAVREAEPLNPRCHL
jgi:hypothetical protein